MTRATNPNTPARATATRTRHWLTASVLTAAAILVPTAWANTANAAAPEGRGYEMVSPPDKNFGDITYTGRYLGNTAVASTGEAASICATSAFAGAHIGVACADYVSRRDAANQRWETDPVLPPYCTIDNTDPDHAFFTHFQFQQGISTDMRRVVSALPEGGGGCPFEPLDPFAPTPSLNVYMFEAGNPASGRLINPEPGAPDPHGQASRLQTYAGNYQAGSEDLSHIVFKSTGQQTPEVPADGQVRLFEWVDGNVSLVTRDTDNVPFATESHLATPTAFWAAFDRYNAVSADGSRIFFVTPSKGDTAVEEPLSGETEIYMRENGAVTHHVSESECTSACGSATGHAKFRYATPAGDKVLFTSPKQLTDDPTPNDTNLYMYTHSDDPANDQNLTLLTQDNEPADGTATTSGNPALIGVLGISDDGDDVYFVTGGQLVPGGPTVTPSQVKLYRWQANGGDPELSYIGALRDAFLWGDVHATADRLVTPDGKHLLVDDGAALDPVADNGPDNDDRDVYRWSEEDGWNCVSCPAAGEPSGGFRGFITEGSGGDRGVATSSDRERRAISDDGSRVFFNSDLGLVPRDTNGIRDVYMWENGKISLVTSGKSPDPSYWIGASADGDDVFFTTRERLVGWDTDSNADLYDARVGGGFPEPPALPAPCSGEECQNPSAGPPAVAGSGSADFDGSGNVGAGARASISVRGLSAAARSALARGAKGRLRLKVNRAGKVTVVGTATVGKERRRVVSSSARAKKAGSVSVTLALSERARAELRRKGSLAVALTVRFRDARPKALAFTVKSASSKKGRR